MKQCGFKVEAFFKSVRPSEQNRVDFRTCLDDRDKVKFEQIMMAKEEDHAFAPYAVLSNIQSLRVGKMSNEITGTDQLVLDQLVLIFWY
jgi:hypothetical protein